MDATRAVAIDKGYCMRKFFCLVIAVLPALMAACDRGLRLYPVKGTVTYDGQPLPAGQIFFEADISKGHDGPQGFAFVKQGKYDTTQGGRGVLGGPYVLRVEGFDGKEGVELPLGRPLFTDFSEQRDLPQQASEQNVTIAARKK